MCVLGPARRETSAVVPTASTFAAADGHGFDDLRLVFCESNARVDDSVEEEVIGGNGGVC